MAAVAAFLAEQVNDQIAGAALGAVSLVLILMAGATLSYAYTACPCRSYPRWHPFRWLPPCFAFWWGCAKTLTSILFAILAVLITTSPGGIARWAFLLCVAVGLAHIVAFRFWARERRVERGEEET